MSAKLSINSDGSIEVDEGSRSLSVFPIDDTMAISISDREGCVTLYLDRKTFDEFNNRCMDLSIKTFGHHT